MQEGVREIPRPPRTPSTIQDNATESAKQTMEGQSIGSLFTGSREARSGSGGLDRASAGTA
ncbi:uncharacterized protein N7529_002624 [Penicillium soppii]|uniref:uncharacterized protein n=1 Tax=Penicillium soppii TaxID=69789 RepID=UPI00254822D4|nr:uncharacterized protein N7529_002624 [Penicillium soppii]KAJ5874194.1 hypothetical protein N7529_002624 [Penicillium soppii]